MNLSKILEGIRRYDFTFFGTAAAIFIIGIINLYSSVHTSTGHLGGVYKTQLVFFVIAMTAGGIVSFIRPKNFFRYSYGFYIINIILLIMVLFMGHKGMGAQRWIVFGPIRFQPSEIMKISVIFALARYYTKNNPQREQGLTDLIIPFIIAFIPALLIIFEPDLGTGLVLLLIFAVISFYRKLKWRSIGIVAIIGILVGGLMFEYGLKPYQKRRISTFLNPGADARGSGYNAIQSKIAIGSGQFFGKGFKKSSQASLNYLPENHTDFVFSIFNEEHGFFGSLVLISLYLILFFRFLWLASSVNRMFDSIVTVGLMSLFFWHTFINMGMVTGIMPIVGLPLPFMSYGGSSMVLFGLCCGVATSISNSRNFF